MVSVFCALCAVFGALLNDDAKWLRRRLLSTGAITIGSSTAAAALSPETSKSIIDERCQDEQSVSGAYFQACMADSQRTFDWPAPVGRIFIEQGKYIRTDRAGDGEVVWNGAQLLADYEARILGPSGYFEGKRVIELGCGTALPSIVASRFGVSSVLATDGSSDVVERAKHNIERNLLGAPPPAANSSGASSLISCRKLLWTGNGVVAKELESAFDVVLAADVLWVLFAQNLLAGTAKALLAPRGEFLLCETGHDGLPLPAALDGFRSVAEGAGLAWEGTDSVPHQVDGFESQVVRLRART